MVTEWAIWLRAGVGEERGESSLGLRGTRGEGEGEEGRGAGRWKEGGAGMGYSSNLISFA